MKRAAALCLILMAVGLACSPAPQSETASTEPGTAPVQVKQPEEPKAPPAIAKMIEERNKLHKRRYGARLLIAAKWEPKPGLEPSLTVDWQIDYDGPRRPFVVLEPRHMLLGGGSLTVRCWYLDAAGQLALYQTGIGQFPGAVPPKQREMYAIAADGKPVIGQFRQSASHMAAIGFGGKEPRPDEPSMWVQMEYETTDRGDGFEIVVNPQTKTSSLGAEFSLDAWTGHLWSPVVRVSAK